MFSHWRLQVMVKWECGSLFSATNIRQDGCRLTSYTVVLWKDWREGGREEGWGRKVGGVRERERERERESKRGKE